MGAEIANGVRQLRVRTRVSRSQVLRTVRCATAAAVFPRQKAGWRMASEQREGQSKNDLSGPGSSPTGRSVRNSMEAVHVFQEKR